MVNAHKATAAELVSLVHAVAMRLAAHLGADWAYNERRRSPDDFESPYATVDSEGGDKSIAVVGNVYEQRVYIEGNWGAKDNNGARIAEPYDMPKIRIGLSAKRDAANLARDAVRRFLPAFEAAWPKYQARIITERSYATAVKAGMAHMVRSGHFEAYPVQGKGSAPDTEKLASRLDQISSVRVYAKSVSMDLRDLSAAQAVAVADLLARDA